MKFPPNVAVPLMWVIARPPVPPIVATCVSVISFPFATASAVPTRKIASLRPVIPLSLICGDPPWLETPKVRSESSPGPGKELPSTVTGPAGELTAIPISFWPLGAKTFPQFSFAGELHQFVVRKAEPQKIGQPGRQREVIERVHRHWIVGPRLRLGAKEEFR